MPADEYLVPVAFTTVGLLFGLESDLGAGCGRRHVFYATRQAYLLMYLYLVMRWLGYSSESSPWMGYLLHMAAPASVSVFLTYHVCVIFMASFDPTSAASFATHIMMPVFAILEYTWDRSEPAWWMAVLVLPAALMLFHMLMETLFWWLVARKAEYVYPEYPTPGKRGLGASMLGLLMMIAVAATHTMLDAYDVARPEWLVTLYMGMVVAMVFVAIVVTILRRRRDAANQYDISVNGDDTQGLNTKIDGLDELVVNQ